MKKVLIIIVISFAVFCMIICYFNDTKPINILRKSLNIKFQIDCTFLEFKYNHDTEGFAAKIKFAEDNIVDVEKEMLSFFRRQSNDNLSDKPNFSNTKEWWDLKDSDINKYYTRDIGSKKKFGAPKTHNVWAFITKPVQGYCYLYISY